MCSEWPIWMIGERSEDWGPLLKQWYNWGQKARKCNPFISNLGNKESTHFLLSGLEWQTGEPACFTFHQDIAGLQGHLKTVCICVAPHKKCYVGAYTLCCYLKHQYQVGVWNSISDLLGKTDPVQYGWINISLLCIVLGERFLRQELTQRKVLSQISLSCSILMNLSLRFANENEVASNANVISVLFFFFFFGLFCWEWSIFFLLLRKPSQSSSIFLMLDAVHEQIMI